MNNVSNVKNNKQWTPDNNLFISNKTNSSELLQFPAEPTNSNHNKKKFFITFKKPDPLSRNNKSQADKIKIKVSRSRTKNQKLLEAAAAKNNNSIKNYVLPRSPKPI